VAPATATSVPDEVFTPHTSFLGLEWRHSAQSYIFPGLAQDAVYLASISAARAQRD